MQQVSMKGSLVYIECKILMPVFLTSQNSYYILLDELKQFIKNQNNRRGAAMNLDVYIQNNLLNLCCFFFGTYVVFLIQRGPEPKDKLNLCSLFFEIYFSTLPVTCPPYAFLILFFRCLSSGRYKNEKF
jgi:hypothetical protein